MDIPNHKGHEKERVKWEEIKENRKWENRDFSVIVDPHLWKKLKEEEEIYSNTKLMLYLFSI